MTKECIKKRLKKILFMKYYQILIATIIFLSSTIFGEEKPTYHFLHQEIDARSSALAGSFVSASNDPNVLYYNPAGLATIQKSQIAFGFTKHLLDVNAGNLSYAQQVEDVGFVGAGIYYINYGSFKETNVFGDENGTFGAGDMLLSVGIARTVEENLSLGISGKFIYSSIQKYSSSAVAADIGVVYNIPGSDPISLAATLANIGTQLSSYSSTTEKLPFEFTIGGNIKPQHLPIVLNLNFHKLNESQDSFLQRFKNFSFGAEILASESFHLRVGYNSERRKELKIGNSAGLAGISFGAGIFIKDIRVDYSFSSLGQIGSINRISLNYNL